MKFVFAEDGTMVNLDHVVRVSPWNTATMVDGESVVLQGDWVRSIGSTIVPAAPSTDMVIVHSPFDGERVDVSHVPVVAWETTYEDGARPVLLGPAFDLHNTDDPSAILCNGVYAYDGIVGDRLEFLQWADEQFARKAAREGRT